MLGASTLKNVLYVTDVEGNWDYFMAFVDRCQDKLYFQDGQLMLHDNYIFVFGGDVGDKGIGTLRIIQLLVNMKLRYQERVVLIAGNRDANKMRWTSEFTVPEMNLATMDPGIKDGPYWIAPEARKNLGLIKFLTKIAEDKGLQVDQVNTKVNRMLWALKCTMGSDGDFERRRVELQTIQSTQKNITDEQVLESFLQSVEEGGIMRKYLQLCVLGYIHGSTLFLHGGVFNTEENGDKEITRYSIGLVPPANSKIQSYKDWAGEMDALSESDMPRLNSIHSWIEKLNSWYTAQINEWIAFPTWVDDTHTFRGGENLQQYVATGAPYSVISGRHLELSGMPKLMNDEMAKLLWRDGIQRLIIGHTPHGNSPTIVKHVVEKENIFEVIMCDTSYSNVRAKDMRGECVSTLHIDTNELVHVAGFIQLDDPSIKVDTEYKFSTMQDNCVGYKLASGEWVKTRLDDEKYLVCKISNSFKYEYSIKPREEVEESLSNQQLK